MGKGLRELLSDRRFVRVAVIVGISAIILIFISSFIDLSPSDDAKLTQRYADQTEARLLDIISSIGGVGEARIFLTMDDSGENVYQKNSDAKTVSIEPKVRGVVVVCDGGDDPVVKSRVLEAVTKALSISSDKVCITK